MSNIHEKLRSILLAETPKTLSNPFTALLMTTPDFKELADEAFKNNMSTVDENGRSWYMGVRVFECSNVEQTTLCSLFCIPNKVTMGSKDIS